MDRAQQDTVIARWRTERGTRPSGQEVEFLNRTISDLKVDLDAEKDPSKRADLIHRLAFSNIKKGCYHAALTWAEKGLNDCPPAWRGRLLEIKAQALFMSGQEMEASLVLDMKECGHHAPVGSDTDPGEALEGGLAYAIRCPDCSATFGKGFDDCPNCGSKIDGRFKLTRVLREDIVQRSGDPLVAPKHRTRSMTFRYRTYTIDNDDPENYLTIRTRRMLGEESIRRQSKVAFFAYLFLLLILIIILLPMICYISIRDGQNGDLAPAVVAVLIVFAPLILISLWFIWPMKEDVTS